jgi:phage terminase Nu1 subunit (DNA packaging protein)
MIGEIATSTELAAFFGCSERTVEALARRGTVVRVDRGRYNVPQSTLRYIARLREQSSRQGHAPHGEDGDSAALGGAVANVTDQYKIAQTQLVQVRLAKEAGLLISVDAVRSGWGRILRQVRQLVLGLPSRMAFEIPSLTAHDRATMERICRDGLTDVAMGKGFTIDTASLDDDLSSDDIDADGGTTAGDSEADLSGRQDSP